MTIFLVSILGAVFNAIRGGLLTDLVSKFSFLKRKVKKTCFWDRYEKEVRHDKLMNDLAFALLFFFVFNLNNLFNLIPLYLGMLAGRSMGWGSYVGGLQEDVAKPDGENKLIDYLFLRYSDNPDIRNMVALGFRGIIWTLCIYFGFLIIDCFAVEVKNVHLIPFVGAPMGLIYNAVFEYEEKNRKFFKKYLSSWRVAELLFGGYLWAAIYLLVR